MHTPLAGCPPFLIVPADVDLATIARTSSAVSHVPEDTVELAGISDIVSWSSRPPHSFVFSRCLSAQTKNHP